MKEVNNYKLDSGNSYNEISSVIYEGDKYLLLSNEEDYKDICLRKVIYENNEMFLTKLTQEEYDEVIKLLIDKNKDLFQ